MVASQVPVMWSDELRPGELLFSFASSLAATNAWTSDRYAITSLFGRFTHAPPSLPVGLDRIFARMGHLAGLSDVDDLISKTTPYPYFRFFMDEGRWQRARKLLRSDRSTGVRALVGARIPDGGDRILRRCVQCDIEAWQAGRPYWHVFHQLPGVRVCAIHGILLASYRVPPEHLFVPPWDLEPPTAPEALPHKGQELARVSLEALEFRGELPDEDMRRAAILEGLRQRGLVKGPKAIQWDATTSDFFAYWKDVGQFRGAFETFQRTSPSWLVAAIRHPAKFSTPLVQIALIAWLYGSVASFVEAWRIPAAKHPIVHSHRVELGRPALHPAVLDCSLSCNRAAQLAGTSAKDVVRHRMAAGLHVDRKPWRVTDGTRERIIGALSLGFSRRSVAAAFRISPDTVTYVSGTTPGARERIACSRNAVRTAHYKEVWLAALREHPDATSTQFREIEPAAFAWLYTHERPWMKANWPTASRPHPSNWNSRDARLTASARKYAARYFAETGEPISRKKLLHAIAGGEANLLQRLDKLPNFARAVAELATGGVRRTRHRLVLTKLGQPLQAS